MIGRGQCVGKLSLPVPIAANVLCLRKSRRSIVCSFRRYKPEFTGAKDTTISHKNVRKIDSISMCMLSLHRHSSNQSPEEYIQRDTMS